MSECSSMLPAIQTHRYSPLTLSSSAHVDWCMIACIPQCRTWGLRSTRWYGDLCSNNQRSSNRALYHQCDTIGRPCCWRGGVARTTNNGRRTKDSDHPTDCHNHHQRGRWYVRTKIIYTCYQCSKLSTTVYMFIMLCGLIALDTTCRGDCRLHWAVVDS